MNTKLISLNLTINLIIVMSVSINANAASTAKKLPLSYTELQQFNTDQTLSHEAYPQGVPTDYSWRGHPAMQSGNNVPAGYTAIIGWGQIMWAQNVTSSPDYVQLQNMKTLICTVNNGVHNWSLLQEGDIEGSEFNSDYVDNINTAPPYFSQITNTGLATVGIDSGNKAFHYWYTQGRSTLPNTNICGTLTIQQARTVTKASNGTSPGSSGAYMISLGGDYWLNTTAAWSQYATNKGIDIGRFKFITGQWKWYGVSTASDADLLNLYQYGYATSNTSNTSNTRQYQ